MGRTMNAAVVVRAGTLTESVFIEDSYGHVPTLQLRLQRRAPLKPRELQPGHFCRNGTSVTDLELELRGVLAARYAETSPHAAARHVLATSYLDQMESRLGKEQLLAAFDLQNTVELEDSKRRYLRAHR